MFQSLDRFINEQKWLDTVGAPLQSYIRTLFESGGDAGKQIKNLLNGTWLGHPAHPMITDVPVGAWTATFVLDTVGNLRDDPALARAADLTLATGWLAGVGAAVTGLTDWSDTYGKSRRVGLAHGLTMVASFTTYTAALLARIRGARSQGVALANLGYLLTAAGAYLGGDEVFDIGYGVNRTAFQSGPRKYTAVMAEADLPADKPTKASAKGVNVVLVKQYDRIYALDDTCVHAGCSLSDGRLEGASIICPCHGSQYALRDGSVLNGPATVAEPHYDVRVQNGTIEVKQA